MDEKVESELNFIVAVKEAQLAKEKLERELGIRAEEREDEIGAGEAGLYLGKSPAQGFCRVPPHEEILLVGLHHIG